jgi:hypothetical protein
MDLISPIVKFLERERGESEGERKKGLKKRKIEWILSCIAI